MTIRTIFLSLLILATPLQLFARKQAKEKPVMTIAGKDVTLSEFNYLYHKNADRQTDPVSLDEYIEMFVNYKLKVTDAEAAGLDTLASFRSEFEGYCKEICAPYLIDNAMLDSLRSAAASHYAINVDVSHIMMPHETPIATVDSLRSALLAGADFAEAANRHSIDRLTSSNGGRLGFIPAGRYPYVFEDVAFNTPVGSISEPVESDAGIHLIRVNAVRDDRGEVKCRHILKLTRGLTPELMAAKRASIDSIAALLDSGADFATVASAETEDPSGRTTGGDLPPFGAGMMVEEFENAAFALAPGERSGVVTTSFGYHIILCEGRRDDKPAAERDSLIRIRMDHDGRTELARRRYFDRFRASHHDLRNADMRALTAAAVADIAATNAELGALLNEYREGMLLYEISNLKVWNRPTADAEGLKKFFDSHRADYVWDSPHYKGYVISASSDSLASAAKDYLAATGNELTPGGYPFALRKRFGSEVKIDRILAARGDNPIVDYLVWGSERPATGDRLASYVIYGGRIIEAPEEPADCGSAVALDWQQALEKEWIATLRATYPVTVNRKSFNK